MGLGLLRWDWGFPKVDRHDGTWVILRASISWVHSLNDELVEWRVELCTQ